MKKMMGIVGIGAMAGMACYGTYMMMNKKSSMKKMLPDMKSPYTMLNECVNMKQD